MESSFENPLPGVPLIESPFFESLVTAARLNEHDMQVALNLRTEGYAVLTFPDSELDRVAEEIKAALTPKYDWQAWRSGTLDSLRIQDAWQTNENVRRIAANSEILSLLNRLFGRRACPFQTLNFAVGTQQHVHSDSVHFSSIPERFMCGVWVALEDIDLENGPLIYYPGSHKWPIYLNDHIEVNSQHQPENYFQYSKFEVLWRKLIEAHNTPAERFQAKKGQALIWLANLLHGGDKQTDLNRTRYSQVTHYYFEGCSYYTPLKSDPFYGKIYFRDLTDIARNEPMENMISGYSVPIDFINRAKPDSQPTMVLPKSFDRQTYLRLNPDVSDANVDPAEHYRTFGWREGRKWSG